ncbi:hypothetical protein MMC13_005838 [Lambiella insularis]|nr:hypothetical protein [Lambiella insularis]
MSSVEPLTIRVSDAELQRLSTKLTTASFPDELEESSWDYGARLADVKRLTAYWKDGFDWPQTLGKGLADSLVGLLAWMYEKVHDWTDDYAWEDEENSTWLSIYWFFTAGPAAA